MARQGMSPAGRDASIVTTLTDCAKSTLRIPRRSENAAVDRHGQAGKPLQGSQDASCRDLRALREKQHRHLSAEQINSADGACALLDLGRQVPFEPGFRTIAKGVGGREHGNRSEVGSAC